MTDFIEDVLIREEGSRWKLVTEMPNGRIKWGPFCIKQVSRGEQAGIGNN